MNDKEFSEILLRLAIAATICDGHCDEQELEVIKHWAQNAFYLKNLDYQEEIQSVLDNASSDILGFLSNTLESLNKLEFTISQKMIAINIIIATIKADNVVQESEINFMRKVLRNMMFSDEIAESIFGKWWIINSDQIKNN
jgi:uncharacterized membrane protein YebE (DUF533 family)